MYESCVLINTEHDLKEHTVRQYSIYVSSIMVDKCFEYVWRWSRGPDVFQIHDTFLSAVLPQLTGHILAEELYWLSGKTRLSE